MKPLRPDLLNKKIKPSKFFENISNSNIPPNAEIIRRNLKFLFRDLVCGTAQQEKYFQYFLGMPKIVDIAIEELTSRQLKEAMYKSALLSLYNTNQTAVIDNNIFDICWRETDIRLSAYSGLLDGLLKFKATQDTRQLIAISAKFGNPTARLWQRVFFD